MSLSTLSNIFDSSVAQNIPREIKITTTSTLFQLLAKNYSIPSTSTLIKISIK